MTRQQEALLAISRFPEMDSMFEFLAKYDRLTIATKHLPAQTVMARVAASGMMFNREES